MNTCINYLYTDASNYKIHNTAIVAGTFTKEQFSDIISTLEDGEFFIPSLVGLPEKRFETYDPQEDHPWFSLDASGFSEAEETPTVSITADELHKRFMAHSA